MKKNFCIVLTAMLFSSLLKAQETPKKDTVSGGLEDVEVSINRWEQRQNEIPNTIARIDIRDARMQNPQTAADLLNITGQVFIQKSQMGGGSPMIRGFSTNRIMIVVDGVRMNNAIFRSGNLQNVISVDPLTIQNAEVIFGPGSIIYGSDAIGGVMDFHTLDPVFSKSKKPLVKLNSFTRFSTANQEKTAHLDFNIASNKVSFLASVTHSKFGDLRMGKNGGEESYLRTFYVERINNNDSVIKNEDPYLQKQTGYNQWNALAKLRYRPTGFIDLQYAYHYSATGNIPRYDRLIETTGTRPSFSEWYYGPQIWKMHQLKAEFLKANNIFNTARVIVSFQDYEESRNDRRFRNARLRNQIETVNIGTINLDFNKSLNEKQELFYGAEYIFNKVGSIASRRNINTGLIEPTTTRYPNNSRWNSTGIYSNYKYRINQKFTLATGARFNYVSLFAPFDNTFFRFPFTEASLKQSSVTGSLGLVFRPGQKWQVNTNFSTGFRVPNIDDIGKVFDSEAGNVIVPNPALKAEYAYNVDVGFAYTNQEKLKVDFTLFYTILDNAIVRRPFTFNGEDSIFYEGILSRVQSLQNVAQASVWGIQAGIEYFFTKEFSCLLRANYIDGKETDDKENKNVRLRHAPPFYGSTAFKFSKNQFAAELSANYNGEISAADLAPSEQAKPFIYAHDVTGRLYSPQWYTINYKSTYMVTKKIQLAAGIENITNQRYRSYSSGIVAPGINFIFSIRAAL